MTRTAHALGRLGAVAAVAILLALATFSGTASAQSLGRGGTGPVTNAALLFDPTLLLLPNVGDSATASIRMENAPAGTLGVQAFIRHEPGVTIDKLVCRGEFEGGVSISVPALGGTIVACVSFTAITTTSGPVMDMTVTRVAPATHLLMFDTSGFNTVFATAATSVVPIRVNTLYVVGYGRG